uniref:Uncharacterized protein n=1 Tax=Anguilla anguilla TaxID=7936 RepID=A0A0E9SN19_ANGAN
MLSPKHTAHLSRYRTTSVPELCVFMSDLNDYLIAFTDNYGDDGNDLATYNELNISHIIDLLIYMDIA